MGIHFVISQIVGYVAILYLSRLFSDETEAYYQSVIVLTGMTGIMAMLISLFLPERRGGKKAGRNHSGKQS